MRRFAACVVAMFAAACSGDSATWSWSFSPVSGCPSAVTQVTVAVREGMRTGGECLGSGVLIANETAPCSAGGVVLTFERPGVNTYCPVTGGFRLDIDALTSSGAVFAHDEVAPYDESDGHTVFPSDGSPP